MNAHPVCDAVDAGHICRTNTGGKDATALPEDQWACKKDGEPWPCSTIIAARQTNADRSRGTRPLRPMHNTPDRLTGASL